MSRGNTWARATASASGVRLEHSSPVYTALRCVFGGDKKFLVDVLHLC